MCGGGGAAPKDNSVELERLRQREARRQNRRDRRADKKAQIEQDEAVAAALSGGQAEVEDYFITHGADPNTPENRAAINNILNVSKGIAAKSANPASEFTDDPEGAWNRAGGALQTKANLALEPYFSTGFENRKYGDALDDPIIQKIMGEDRINSEEYLKNLLKRGVITEGGYEAGVRDLDRQGALAQAKLNTFGQQEIEEGRAKGREIGTSARGAAAQLNPGSQPFNAGTFASELDTAFNDFLQNLEVNIRGNLSGNLFDTTGLADVAGAAQGGGNFKYDPKALSGIIEPDEEDTDTELSRLEGSSGIF